MIITAAYKTCGKNERKKKKKKETGEEEKPNKQVSSRTATPRTRAEEGTDLEFRVRPRETFRLEIRITNNEADNNV